MIIIGLSGYKGVGKTSAADYLVRYRGFKKLSFSTRLKELSRILIPEFTETMLFGNEKEVSQSFITDHTPREFMERLGEFMRFWRNTYWLDIIKNGVENNHNFNIVIDDVRYPNEAEYLRKLDGILVRVNRYKSKNPYSFDPNSPSEISLDKFEFDHTVEEYENISLLDLYKAVDRVLVETQQHGKS